MRSFFVVATAAFALLQSSSIQAHTFLDRLILPNGKNGQCVQKTAAPAGQRNFPIKDLASKDMICGAFPTQAATETCPVAAGESLKLVYGHNTPQDDVIDPTHVGPINVYLAAMPADGSMPSGEAWFKIFDEGFKDNTWATHRLIQNKGLLDVKIPNEVPAGKYLMRSEISALHEADALVSENPARGNQFYVFCSQLEVSGSGNSDASPKVTIPGHLSPSSPGVKFNIYNTPANQYPTLGPQVAKFSGASKPAPAPAPAPPSKPQPAPAPAPAPAPPAKPQPAPAPAPPTGQLKCQDVQPACFAALNKCWDDFNACVRAKGWVAECQNMMPVCDAKNKECNNLKCTWNRRVRRRL